MTMWTRLGTALAATTLLWSATAFGQATYPPTGQARTPETVDGKVVKIDRTQGRVTIRAANGAMHEFQASKETLQDLKEGDHIEARLRPRQPGS